MQVVYNRLTDFIAGEKIFLVPSFQRNYEWQKEHCAQLFEDINNILTTSKGHFIGTIILQKPEDGKYIIIDGQQRLTSFLLLAKAINDVTGIEKYLFKLRPSEFDREVFDKIMNGAELNEQEKSSRLYQNYIFFKENLKGNAESIRDGLSKLKIVSMELDEKEDAQEIFESLNSTGKDLTETELIKNFLLMNLAPVAQEKFYRDYWLKMERLLQSSNAVEKFMFHYLVMKRKSITDMQNKKNIHISKQNLYYTFKRYFKEHYDGDKPAQTEKFLQDMYRYAEFYSRLLYGDDTDFNSLSALDKKFYELVYLVGSDSAPIILMYLNDLYERGDFGEAEFIEFVDALISLMFRAKVCRLTGIDSTQNAGNILSRLNERALTIDNFWAVLNEGKGKYTFPNNEEFQRALSGNEIYLALKDNCKYFLYAMERSRAEDLPNYNEISFECVMPRKLTGSWKKYLRDKNDLDAAEMWVNALGNLALVENGTGKAVFADKRIEYAQSKFFFTKDLIRNTDWTSKQIQARSRKLAELALKIWTLPEKYNVTPNVSDQFYLNSNLNFGFFTGKIPATISIFGKETGIMYWNELYRNVMRELYELDKNVFVQSVRQKNVPSSRKLLSTNSSELFQPVHIADDYYMRSNFDAKSLLKITAYVVENFERLSGTDFKNEIWFTLKN